MSPTGKGIRATKPKRALFGTPAGPGEDTHIPMSHDAAMVAILSPHRHICQLVPGSCECLSNAFLNGRYGRKKPNWPSSVEWIDKRWPIHSVEYSKAIQIPTGTRANTHASKHRLNGKGPRELMRFSQYKVKGKYNTIYYIVEECIQM